MLDGPHEFMWELHNATFGMHFHEKAANCSCSQTPKSSQKQSPTQAHLRTTNHGIGAQPLWYASQKTTHTTHLGRHFVQDTPLLCACLALCHGGGEGGCKGAVKPLLWPCFPGV